MGCGTANFRQATGADRRRRLFFFSYELVQIFEFAMQKSPHISAIIPLHGFMDGSFESYYHDLSESTFLPEDFAFQNPQERLELP